jgi:predicted metal-dependent enzyme (double-stranded beta helix superfamily)
VSDYSIDQFIADATAIVAEGLDNRQVLQKMVPLAKRVSQDTSWVQLDFYDCDEEQGFGITMLHVADDESLSVQTVCWLPGRGVAPHDHQTWGIVVGLDGVEKNVNWLRQDDGSRPGYADIAAHHEVMVGAGDACSFLPDDIHSVENDGDKPTLSLHLYGAVLANNERSEFDPEAKVQRPCPKRVRKAAN